MIEPQETVEAPVIVLPRELDRAFAFTWFSPPESVILQRVREACFAAPPGWDGRLDLWAQSAACRLDLAMLAESTGIPLSILDTARWRLVASNVLLVDDRGDLLVNERFDQWIHPAGGPRLSPRRLAFCRAGSEEGGDDGR